MRLGADSDALERLASDHDVCAAHLARVRRRLRALDRTSWRGPAARRWWSSMDEIVVPGLVVAGNATSAAARELRRHARAQRAASLAPAATSVHLLDTRGDGRWIARVGSDRADIVVVVVPGVSTDLADRDRLSLEADRMWRSLVAHGGAPTALGSAAAERIAVLAWLGYDPPDHLLAGVDPRPAREGAAALAAEVQALRRRGVQRVVLVGHSYGALVAVRAAADGAGVDEVVLLGAPGLGLDPGGAALEGVGLWSATARGDAVSLLARAGLVHGTDPASVARHLPTGGHGHSSYLSDEVLLDALAAVVLGLPPAVGG